jgi:CheY-like chemotaxis protein
VEIRQHIGDALPPILGDPSQLQQVVINLCSNAAQSMEPSGGTLTVELGGAVVESRDAPATAGLPEGAYLRLRVTDTGPGIAPELQERIFEPYFTTKGVGEGSGLGLAVARGIVSARGGEIFLESRQGRGATFTVYLPATEAPPDETAGDAAPELQTGDERVLFVDDEPAIRMLGRRMLEHLGYTVEARADGRDALECFQADPYGFDLVITDMTMPQMKGDALARALLAIRPELPVILCTGYSTQAAAEAAGDIGIREFVKKPLTVYTLGRTIRKALD